MLQALICRALFPKVLRVVVSRISAFRDYSVFFTEDSDLVGCFVQTWYEDSLFSVCIRLEVSGQRVSCAELAGLSRIVGSLPSCQLPLSCQGGSPTLVRVLNDNRVSGRQFIVCRACTEKLFLQCYQEAHQAIFGGLEVTSMVDFLMLRLRGPLQESWMEDVPVLRRCVAAGHVMFCDLYKVVSELLPIWNSVREFVRFSGPRHVKCEADKVIISPF